jgi:hypothetical protein
VKKTFSIGFFAVVGITIAACTGNPDELTGMGVRPGGDGQPCESNSQCASNVCEEGKCVGDGPSVDPAALKCTQGPNGRSYVLFDGSKLEAKRDNENVGINRARVKPYPTLEKEFQRVLGVVPPSLKNSAASFDSPATRWFQEADLSGVSLNAFASIAFEACSAYTKSASEFASAPTEESAKEQCKKLMRKAWSRSASPDEISGCAKLATTINESDVRKKWAYTCTSVLSAAQFLTF